MQDGEGGWLTYDLGPGSVLCTPFLLDDSSSSPHSQLHRPPSQHSNAPSQLVTTTEPEFSRAAGHQGEGGLADHQLKFVGRTDTEGERVCRLEAEMAKWEGSFYRAPPSH